MIELKLIEIEPLVDKRIIKESLCRMGIGNIREKILYPSCYLYSQQDRSFIVHFKELFLLTREDAFDNRSEEDINRRNAIAWNLAKWGLIRVLDESILDPHSITVFVLPHSLKSEWIINHKISSRMANN
jgi:hypothetical protein